MKTIKLFTVLAILHFALYNSSNAQNSNSNQVLSVHPSAIIYATKIDSSNQRQYKNIVGSHNLFMEEFMEENEHRNNRMSIPESGDAVQQSNNDYINLRSGNCPNPPVVQTNFEGNQRNRLNFPPLGWYPSECNIAISNAGMIVSISGSWMYYFDEKGKLLFSDSLYHFANGILDVHVVYDPKADRFIFCINRGFTDWVTWFTPAPPALAFSKTNNPMDGWNYYIIPATDYHDGSVQDYPLIAISDSEVFMTSSYSNNSAEHREIVQINKSSAYAGAATISIQKYDAPLSGSLRGSMVPAQGGSSTYGPNMYFLMANEHSNGSNKYAVYEITNTIASGMAVLNRYGPISSNVSYTGNGLLFQYGGLPLEDQVAPVNDNVENAFYENGLLQFCQISKANGNGKAAVIAGRVGGIPNNLSCTAKLISDPNLYLSFPSIAYAGNSSTDNSAIVGLEHSGTNIYPGLSAVYVNSAFEVSSLVTVKAGNDTINGAYGDYSGICRRYNHPGEVWFEGQYGSLTEKKINWIAKLQSPATCLDRIAGEEFNNGLRIMPNPIINSTTISFSLPQSEKISLNIFDLNGRLVKTFVDGEMKEGDHQIELSATDINAGVYFLQFQSAEFSKMEKLMVIK